MDRRHFLRGIGTLLAAPAIVRASSLMAISPALAAARPTWEMEPWPTIGYVVGYDRATPHLVKVGLYGRRDIVVARRFHPARNPLPKLTDEVLVHSSGQVVTLPHLGGHQPLLEGAA